jgi:acylphosphatase
MKVGIFRVKVRAYITVFGRIQGVFEGEDKTVQKLVEFCKVGALGARVDSVNVILQEYIGEFMDFHIKW